MRTSHHRFPLHPLLLALACFPWTRAAPAENRFFIPQVNVPEGSQGSKIYVHASHDTAISAFSLSIRYDAAALEITDVTYDGTSVVDPAFWEGSHDSGMVVYGALLDLTMPFTNFLPPASDHTLACLRANALAAAPSDVTLWFVQIKGTIPPQVNVITDLDGNTITPVLQSGLVRILHPQDLLPQANAGPDQMVPEVSAVTLDGSLSSSPQGKQLSFGWAQISGPPVQDARGADSARFSFNVPPVAADTDLVFELTVSDGQDSSKDRVSVRAVDLDSRQAEASRAPNVSPALIDGGSRAVVFHGTMNWSSPYEDGIWTRARFHAIGKGDESWLLSGASLWLDVNGNGSLDSGDFQAGEVSPILEDNGTVEFDLFQTLDGVEGMGFFLVVDVSPEARGVQGWILAPLALALGGLLLARRSATGGRTAGKTRGKARRGQGALFLTLCAALSVSLCLGLSACGGGGGGGGGSDPSREVRFSIQSPSDLGVQGATTGVQVSAQNLPLNGPAVKV